MWGEFKCKIKQLDLLQKTDLRAPFLWVKNKKRQNFQVCDWLEDASLYNSALLG